MLEGNVYPTEWGKGGKLSSSDDCHGKIRKSVKKKANRLNSLDKKPVAGKNRAAVHPSPPMTGGREMENLGL